jgi:hypothetical protein
MITSFDHLSFADEIKVDCSLPGVDIRDVKKLASDFKIPKENLARLKPTLAITFSLHRTFKNHPPLGPEKMREALRAFSHAAQRLERLLKDLSLRLALIDALAEKLSTHGEYPYFVPPSCGQPTGLAFGEDTRLLALSMLSHDCQGVSHLVQLADHACQKWGKEGSPFAVEEGYVPKKSASKPEIAIITAAIYTMWADLGKRPLIGKKLSSEFIKFAKRVFKLNGEDVKDSALCKRLKDPSWKMFVPDEVKRKIDELNSV